jgi:hypothetical protein
MKTETVDILNHPFIANNQDISDKIKFILSRKGQFCSFRAKRSLKTLKGFQHLNIEKESSYSCRIGIEYENMAAIKEIREGGKEASGLKGKRWLAYPYFLASESTENIFVRLYAIDSAKGLHGTNTKYFLNGEEKSKEDIRPYCLANEFASDSYAKPCIDFPLNSILAGSFSS